MTTISKSIPQVCGRAVWCLILVSASCLFFCNASTVRGDDSDLLLKQKGVGERYKRLEESLLRLADAEAAENPERASLLRQAAKLSRDQFVLEKLRKAASSIENENFPDAITNQESAGEGLARLLTLLQSEDRSKRIRNEKERVTKLISDLKRIERAQRSTRARNENGADLKEVQQEQESIAERSKDLKDQITEDENEFADSGEEEASDGEEKSGEKESGEQQSGEQKSDEQKSDEQKSGEQKSGEQNSGEQNSGEQKSGEQQSGEQQSGEQNQSSQQPQTPQQQAEDELQQAIDKMEQAQKDLDEAKRDKAAERQKEAEAQLRKAIDRLEKILRQLREEEMLRELARLEGRLKRMAAMQSKVYDDTVALSAIPKEQRNRQTDLKAGNLGFEEKKITMEADRAMLLLREEGSSVAFPEVVAQIRDDTQRVAQRLGESKIDAVTQGVQQDILAALEEMILSLQQAQRDLEKQQKSQQSQQGQPGGQQEQPLVDAIAELKLIRTMETRIKSTTGRYRQMLSSEESTEQELLPMIKTLSDRQNRLYQITRDLVMRRNK